MNIEKYLNNATQTSEGVIYKNDAAFRSKKGICHIGEFALELMREVFEQGKDLTDDELVEEGFADTYDTIIEEVNEKWDCFEDDVKAECSVEDIAEQAFENALWTCISTEIEQMTY